MTQAQILRVFTDEQGNFGDTATVVFDEGRAVADGKRQAIAQKLEAVETAFVDDVAANRVSFMHSQGEIDFAGVPALGVAWLLGKHKGNPISSLETRGGEVTVSHEEGLTWVRAGLATMPPWNHIQYSEPQAIERISLSETQHWAHTVAWAWVDEHKGTIRARTFAADWDIPEAMGNGSGSMLLAHLLERAIEVRHGKGSVIYARPASNDYADVGGRVQANSLVTV